MRARACGAQVVGDWQSMPPLMEQISGVSFVQHAKLAALVGEELELDGDGAEGDVGGGNREWEVAAHNPLRQARAGSSAGGSSTPSAAGEAPPAAAASRSQAHLLAACTDGGAVGGEGGDCWQGWWRRRAWGWRGAARAKEAPQEPAEERAPWVRQAGIILWRGIVDSLRSPSLILMHVAASVVIGLVVGFTVFNTGNDTAGEGGEL